MLFLAGCLNQPDYRAETAPPATVDRVDLERYQGLWYEIARYPNFFEDKDRYTCVSVTAEYALRLDGRIDVTNSCRENTPDGPLRVAEGVARATNTENTRLKVKFAPAWVPFAEGDYWVLGLTEDYSAALVGDPNGQYLWVLARTPDPDPSVYQAMLATAAAKGYKTDPLVRTRH